MTLTEWQKNAALRLERSNDPDAEWDAKLFLCAVTGLEPGCLRLKGTQTLSDAQLETLEKMLLRREAGEPEQYIEGKSWFMGLEFDVDERVLIPRQDTETLCEAGLDAIKNIAGPDVCDLCTGSGALAVAIAVRRPDARVTAADISAEALAVAENNARKNGAKVEFVRSDGMTELKGKRYDLIVCNPPYLSEADMRFLQTEVRREPALALFGGRDGLDFYRRFTAECAVQLKPGGTLAFEVGADQADEVERLLAAQGAYTGRIRDLCGVERVIYLRKQNDTDRK